MYRELNNLAEDFIQYRGNKKRAKYPQFLWDRAIEMCKHHSAISVAKALQVNIQSLNRHLKPAEQTNCNAETFIPIQIAHSAPSVQLYIKSSLPMTIDFNRSTEELAKLILAIQGGLLC